MGREGIQDHEWLSLVLLGGGGLLWGLISLLLGFSGFYFGSSGVTRIVLNVFILPLHVAFWVGSALQPPVIDPSGMVIATGGVLGLLLAGGFVVIMRWRDG